MTKLKTVKLFIIRLKTMLIKLFYFMLIIKPVKVKKILTICGMLAEYSHNLTATRPSHTCGSSKTRAPSVTQRLTVNRILPFQNVLSWMKDFWTSLKCCMSNFASFYASSDDIMLVWQHAMRGWNKQCVSVSAYCIHVWVFLAYLSNPHCLRTKN